MILIHVQKGVDEADRTRVVIGQLVQSQLFARLARWQLVANVTILCKGLLLDTFVFLAKVCNLKLLFSRKHTEYMLVFFSHLEINGRKLYVG